MRVKIDPGKCIASGACWTTAPAVFGQDEDGLVVLLDSAPGEALHDLVRAAAAACPAAVITVEEG